MTEETDQIMQPVIRRRSSQIKKGLLLCTYAQFHHPVDDDCQGSQAQTLLVQQSASTSYKGSHDGIQVLSVFAQATYSHGIAETRRRRWVLLGGGGSAAGGFNSPTGKSFLARRVIVRKIKCPFHTITITISCHETFTRRCILSSWIIQAGHRIRKGDFSFHILMVLKRTVVFLKKKNKC